MKPKAKLGTAFRQLLRGSTLAALISALPLAAQAADSVNVAGYGGATWDAITRDYLVPLKAKTGLDVKLVTEPNLAKLKAMVEAGRCEYQVIELSGSEFDIAKNSGWLQKIDYSIVDPENRMPAEAEGSLRLSLRHLLGIDRLPRRQISQWRPEGHGRFLGCEEISRAADHA